MKSIRLALGFAAALNTVNLPVAYAEESVPPLFQEFVRGDQITSPAQLLTKTSLLKYSKKPLVNFWSQVRPFVSEESQKPVDELLAQNPNQMMPEMRTVRYKLSDGREGVRLVLTLGKETSSLEFIGTNDVFVTIDGVSFSTDEVFNLKPNLERLQKASGPKTSSWFSETLRSTLARINWMGIESQAWGELNANNTVRFSSWREMAVYIKQQNVDDNEAKAHACRLTLANQKSAHDVSIYLDKSNPREIPSIANSRTLKNELGDKPQTDFKDCYNNTKDLTVEGRPVYSNAERQAVEKALQSPKEEKKENDKRWAKEHPILNTTLNIAKIVIPAYLALDTLSCLGRVKSFCNLNLFAFNKKTFKKASASTSYDGAIVTPIGCVPSATNSCTTNSNANSSVSASGSNGN